MQGAVPDAQRSPIQQRWLPYCGYRVVDAASDARGAELAHQLCHMVRYAAPNSSAYRLASSSRDDWSRWRASGNPSSVIEIGQIVLDMAVRAVCRSGVPVPLTATEYALVELLALHHGKLVTRSMIHDHLFDDQDDRLSNLIEVHVSNVRRKLGKEFISTRRGHGYIIEKRPRDGHAPQYAGRDAEQSV